YGAGPTRQSVPGLLARVAEREHHPDAARRRGLPRSPPPRREKTAGASAVYLYGAGPTRQSVPGLLARVAEREHHPDAARRRGL
ncbi:hypothetical protein CP988_17755, partial [Enterococcus faecium]